MKTSGIYKIQSKIKPKRFYIGSSQDIEGRWLIHLRELRKNHHHSPKLQNHFNKYGENDLGLSILLGCEKEDLIKTEQYFLDTHHCYFNVCRNAGSHLGMKRSKESCKRISESKKGEKHWTYGKPLSEELKHKLSIALKGRISPMKGRKQSAETIEKRIQKLKGHPNYLLHHSEQTKEKIRNANKGENNYWFGKHHTEETKQRISRAKKGKPLNKKVA